MRIPAASRNVGGGSWRAVCASLTGPWTPTWSSPPAYFRSGCTPCISSSRSSMPSCRSFWSSSRVVKPHREWKPSQSLGVVSRARGCHRGLEDARPFRSAGRELHRRHPCGAQAAARLCATKTSPLTTRRAIIPRWMEPAGYRLTCTLGILVPSPSPWRSRKPSRKAKFPRQRAIRISAS